MKLSSLIITALLTFSALAQRIHTPEGRLRIALDEFAYTTEVEWDQKDIAFYQNAVEKFSKEVEQLRNEGLSVDSILALAAEESKDLSLKSEIDTIRKLVDSQKLSNEELLIRTRELLKNTYSRGASWSPEADIIMMSLPVIILTAGIMYSELKR